MGTASIRSLAVRGISPANIEIIAATETPATAFRCTSPRDDFVPDSLSGIAELKAHLDQVSRRVGEPVAEVVCCCSAVKTVHRNLHRSFDLLGGPRVLEKEVLRNLLESMYQQAARFDMVVSTAVAYELMLDGARWSDPCLAPASRLDLSLRATLHRVRDLGGLTNALQKAGVDLRLYVDWSTAAELALLTPEERAGHCKVIDIGFDLTRALTVREGLPVSTLTAHMGGRSVAADLAHAIRNERDEAESGRHGLDMAAYIRNSDDPTKASPVEAAPEKRTEFLAQVEEARLKEILCLVRSREAREGDLDGVVLTGGGARYDAAATLAGEIYGAEAVVRHHPAVYSGPGLPTDGSWAIAYGVCLARAAAADASAIPGGQTPHLLFPAVGSALDDEIARRTEFEEFLRTIGSRFAEHRP